MPQSTFDVLIIGAGLSGIGVACRLSRECPNKTFAILDRRRQIGGTWDLFRYPGVRSDTDAFTMCYEFRPWGGAKSLADGSDLRDYIERTAYEHGVHRHVHFDCEVSDANWSSVDRCWHVSTIKQHNGKPEIFRGTYLVMATGYFNHERGYTPDFVGVEDFAGQLIHPQNWPEELDYRGKRVVVIGSGATAITLVPAMAQQGVGHITMLQRSPSYIFSVPPEDAVYKLLSEWLSPTLAYSLTRWRNMTFYVMLWKASKRFPGLVRRILLRGVRKQIDDSQMVHFLPNYRPWDERICAVPGNDLFRCITQGIASVVTDHIERFESKGLRLKSGQLLEADIIVTATGLNLQAMGGVAIKVDNQLQAIHERRMYKAVLLEGLPNFAHIMGYVNYPWTLKADLSSKYICRLIQHMDEKGYGVAIPASDDGKVREESIMFPLESGYVRRGRRQLARQGEGKYWEVAHNYASDKQLLLHDPVDGGPLRFDPQMIRPLRHEPHSGRLAA